MITANNRTRSRSLVALVGAVLSAATLLSAAEATAATTCPADPAGGDGCVSLDDALSAMDLRLGVVEMTPELLCAADVAGPSGPAPDGVVDILDILYLREVALGNPLLTTAPCSAGCASGAGTPYEVPETSCDQIDNDCDGQVDEDGACCLPGKAGCPCAAGSCESDTKCVAGTCQPCAPGSDGCSCTGAGACDQDLACSPIDQRCSACPSGTPGCPCGPAGCAAGSKCTAGICTTCSAGSAGCTCTPDKQCGLNLACNSTTNRCDTCAWGSPTCPCSGTNCTGASMCVSGTCQACTPGTSGCSCDASKSCDSNLECNKTTLRCEACVWGTAGCPCNAGACASGTLCSADTCQTCTPGTLGCNCNGSGQCSQTDVTCDAQSGRCESCPFGTSGCPCGNGCDTGTYCSLPSSSGVCADCGPTSGCCSMTDECAVGQTCQDGLCADTGGSAGAKCVVDAECEGCLVCDGGQCAAWTPGHTAKAGCATCQPGTYDCSCNAGTCNFGYACDTEANKCTFCTLGQQIASCPAAGSCDPDFPKPMFSATGQCGLCPGACQHTGEDALTAPLVVPSLGTCNCALLPGWYLSSNQLRTCDEDGDGWISDSAALETWKNPGNVAAANCKSALRWVGAVDLIAEDGLAQQIPVTAVVPQAQISEYIATFVLKGVDLNGIPDGALPLVEPNELDQSNKVSAKLPNFPDGSPTSTRKAYKAELNPLVKYCVGGEADYNFNGAKDATEDEHQLRLGSTAAQTVWNRFSYFGQLYMGRFIEETTSPHIKGRWEVRERNRDLPASDPARVTVGYLPDTASDHWKRCRRLTDAKYKTWKDTTPVGFDFAGAATDSCTPDGQGSYTWGQDLDPSNASTWKPDTMCRHMGHHAQFRCVLLTTTGAANGTPAGLVRRTAAQLAADGWTPNLCTYGVDSIVDGVHQASPKVTCTPKTESEATTLATTAGRAVWAALPPTRDPGGYVSGCIDECQDWVRADTGLDAVVAKTEGEGGGTEGGPAPLLSCPLNPTEFGLAHCACTNAAGVEPSDGASQCLQSAVDGTCKCGCADGACRAPLPRKPCGACGLGQWIFDADGVTPKCDVPTIPGVQAIDENDCNAQFVYVTVGGDDVTGAGTREAPFASVFHAVDVAVATPGKRAVMAAAGTFGGTPHTTTGVDEGLVTVMGGYVSELSWTGSECFATETCFWDRSWWDECTLAP